MTGTINEARALLADAECNDTIGAVTVRVVVRALVANLEAARADLAAARQERDTEADAVTEQRKTIKGLRAELAAARAAMPSEDTATLVEMAVNVSPLSGASRAQVRVWMSRLGDYHAAHPTTPSEPRSNRTEATMRELSGATMDRIEFALVDQEAVLDDIGNNPERADTARALAEFRAWRASRKAPQPVPMTVAELFGAAPDLPEPCAVCSEALCECGRWPCAVCLGTPCGCGTGRAGGGGS